jgi:hypothetical protein
MDTILEYYLINPITNIDYKNHCITISHNIDFIMVNILHIKLDTPSLESIKKISSVSRYKDLKNYFDYLQKQLKLQQPLEYGINYFIVPLELKPNKLILGGIFFGINNDKFKYHILESHNYIIPILSIESNRRYNKVIPIHKNEIDILAAVISRDTNEISREMKIYFMNAHNYLPKFRIIRLEKKIKMNNAFNQHSRLQRSFKIV